MIISKTLTDPLKAFCNFLSPLGKSPSTTKKEAIGLNSDFFLKKATDALENNDFELAIELFQRFLDINRNNPEAAYKIGNCFSELGRFMEAVQYFDLAIELKPNYDRAFYNRGLAFYFSGDREQALASFDRASEFAADRSAYYLDLSKVFKITDYEMAKYCCKQAGDIIRLAEENNFNRLKTLNLD